MILMEYTFFCQIQQMSPNRPLANDVCAKKQSWFFKWETKWFIAFHLIEHAHLESKKN